MRKQFLLILLILSAIAAKGQWVRLPENFNAVEISTIKNVGGTLFVSAMAYGTWISTIYKSTDSGLSWIPIDTSSGYHGGYHTQFSSLGRNIFVADSDSGIYRSVDAGNTWQRVLYVFDVHYFPMAVRGPEIFVGTDYGQIYHSLDSGSSWTLVTSTPCSYVTRMSANSTHVFASHCRGIIILDGTGKWSMPLSGITDQNELGHAITSKGSFTFANIGSDVFRSSDNGANWIRVTNSVDHNMIRCFGVSNANLLSSSKAGVYASNDNGLHWVFAGSGLGGSQVNAFDTLGRFMFAAALDGVYRIDMSQIAKGTADEPINQATVPVFPNPFSDHLDITVNEETNLTIIDMFSRPVLQTEFTQTVSLSTGHLTSGIYYYELRNRNGIIQSGKICKP